MVLRDPAPREPAVSVITPLLILAAVTSLVLGVVSLVPPEFYFGVAGVSLALLSAGFIVSLVRFLAWQQGKKLN